MLFYQGLKQVRSIIKAHVVPPWPLETFIRPTECTTLRNWRRNTEPDVDVLASRIEGTPPGTLASICIQPEQACNKPSTIPAAASQTCVQMIWHRRDSGLGWPQQQRLAYCTLNISCYYFHSFASSLLWEIPFALCFANMNYNNLSEFVLKCHALLDNIPNI